MRLSTVSLAVEDDDDVRAYYTPSSVTWLSHGDAIRHSDLVHVWIGSLTVYGPPVLVVELLGRALMNAYAAWGEGRMTPSSDSPDAAVGAVARSATDFDGEGDR